MSLRKKHALGKQKRRLILCRQLLAAKDNTGEEPASWPEPEVGTNEYWASLDQMTAGETIAAGIRQSTESMRLRLDRRFPGRAVDRVRDKGTGTLYSITGVAPDDNEKVITIENVARDPGVLLADNGQPLLLDDGGFILLEG